MDLNAIRRQFPVAGGCVYFNHAAVAPLSTPVRQAMERHLADQAGHGARHMPAWVAGLEHTRAAVARLLSAAPDSIALLKNTSEGLAAVALGLDWRAGDRVVSFASEFPANLYPWLALRPRGVEVELLPEAALLDLDRVRQACRGARLLAVSFVQYLSGLRADCAALGAICRDSGTLLVVDGIQGLGAFPLDVAACGIHACAAGSQKWLTGPVGAGFLYLAPELLAQLQPAEVGWLSVDSPLDFDAAARAAATPPPLHWHPGAARFECGSPNFAGAIGLGAALDLLQQAGIPAIADHLIRLGDHLAAGLRNRGCQLLRPAEAPDTRSGITSFRHPSLTADELVARLDAASIVCSARSGWVRLSPHLYNTFEEADRLLEILP